MDSSSDVLRFCGERDVIYMYHLLDCSVKTKSDIQIGKDNFSSLKLSNITKLPGQCVSTQNMIKSSPDWKANCWIKVRKIIPDP